MPDDSDSHRFANNSLGDHSRIPLRVRPRR